MLTALVRPDSIRAPDAGGAGRAIAQRLLLRPGEQPRSRPLDDPVGTQLAQQTRRQGHQPILASLPLPHVHHHPAAVDVGHLQVQQLAEAQAERIRRLQQHAVTARVGGLQESQHLFGAEHARQLLRLLAKRKQRHLPVRPA